MNIGERIRYFRELRGLSQQELGMKIGFSEEVAERRISQYEQNLDIPDDFRILYMSEVLNIAYQALQAADETIMHALFALEDLCGLKVGIFSGTPVVYVDEDAEGNIASLFKEWAQKAKNLRTGVISQAEYDEWRHRF